jgi:hypothetical protein
MKATMKPTIEAYMELVKTQGDVETFLNECFGTEEDFDNKACDSFADEVQPELQKFLDERITNEPAPEGVMEAVEEMVVTEEVAMTPPEAIAETVEEA